MDFSNILIVSILTNIAHNFAVTFDISNVTAKVFPPKNWRNIREFSNIKKRYPSID